MTTFDFNGNALRTFEKDGEHCFVARDVCDCLEIQDAEVAVRKLDDDERGTCLIRTPVTKNMIYVTESGLYTLTLRSRKAVTPGTPQHRFRKWVTGEVLPSLRKTGSYAPAPEPVIAVPVNADRALLNNEMNARAAMIRECRTTFGREAAMSLWPMLGLPDVARDGVNELAGTARDDGEGCLKHLLNQSAGGGMTVKQVLSNALHDRTTNGAHRVGCKVDVPRRQSCIAISNTHPFLSGVFEGTQWAGNWRDALLSLDGACRSGNPMKFGKRPSRAVIIPQRHIDW
ncbi:BRO family protein [Cohaesibacter sp. ES.047]|uniref:BRO-N domain-containing protein n=1 Tax=Cohaesibacter sp. ES.047 TaxID=1798205 RepID=UPI00210FF2E3|nr:BRO family protein [Cohaesibacter sp. ES.047]